MILNGTIVLPEHPEMIDLSQDMEAKSNGTGNALVNITVNATNGTITYKLRNLFNGSYTAPVVYKDGAWTSILWRGLIFNNQLVSDEFYCWANNKVKLHGTYLFNDGCLGGGINHEENVQFISNGKNYSRITLYGFPELYYDNDFVYALDKGWMLGEEYRTLTFDNQTVSEEFYTWFTANATEVTE